MKSKLPQLHYHIRPLDPRKGKQSHFKHADDYPHVYAVDCYGADGTWFWTDKGKQPMNRRSAMALVNRETAGVKLLKGRA